MIYTVDEGFLLDAKERCASLLLDLHLNRGFCAGSFYPGDTIRKAFNKLERLGMLNKSTNIPSEAGVNFLRAHHITIPLSY